MPRGIRITPHTDSTDSHGFLDNLLFDKIFFRAGIFTIDNIFLHKSEIHNLVIIWRMLCHIDGITIVDPYALDHLDLGGLPIFARHDPLQLFFCSLAFLVIAD